jgi:amino acid adenylation domain-containing protein
VFDRSEGRSLRSDFLRNAKTRPDALAIVVRGVTRSYGELEEAARRWAAAIIEVCPSRPERVGVFAYRSETSYCGTLAALFSGAAFVPLNPSFPAAKTAAMIQKAALDAIIVDKTCAPLLTDVLAGLDAPPLLMPEFDSPQVPNISTRVLGSRDLSRVAPLNDMPAVTPEDIAYILFTSGSTGAPKGVPVTHGNVMHFIDVMTQRYDIRPDDRFSQTFDQTFDLSVFDLFMAWSSGACVYSMSTVELLSPTGFVNRNGLTVWFSVPSVAVRMLRRNTLVPDSMPSLRWSLFCGEPLPRTTAEGWQDAARNSVVENLYGPTELTIACFTHRWDPQRSPDCCHNDLVPIGRPFPGLGALLVDDNLQPVPNAEMGELCVNGPQTTPGYWQDPVKTVERYVNLPISAAETRRFYRTGDRVLRLPDGEYVFCGRLDDQIKVLGHRMELGEVEAALRAQNGVEHAVAFGWPWADGSAQGIVAFVSGESLNSTSLIENTKLVLPAYAVPARIYVVADMPLNANGKVDRRALHDQLSAMQ